MLCLEVDLATFDRREAQVSPYSDVIWFVQLIHTALGSRLVAVVHGTIVNDRRYLITDAKGNVDPPAGVWSALPDRR
jgi:hypothetical protein